MAAGGTRPTTSSPDGLRADLERALLRELVVEYRRLNQDFFRGTLELPSLELSDSTARLGAWHEGRRSLELSRAALLHHGWGVVQEVMKHEMAHQYVSEVLREREQTSHGPAFRDVCRRLGIDGAASGVPKDEGGEEGRLVERISKLLALAESPNVHEAETAAALAQRLMLKHNLEVVGGTAERRAYGFRHVGVPKGRIEEAERLLATLLGRHYFVEVIWVPVYVAQEGRRKTVLEMCGSEANLAMAEYVHAFLTQTAEQLWVEHKKRLGIRKDRDRRVFLAGVMAGFEVKLARQASRHREEGLVWVGDADLSGYFKKRHPHVRHVRYGGHRKNAAFDHGKAAGGSIVIRKGMTAGPAESGRLLPAARR